MSGLTPDVSRVKVEGGAKKKSPGKRHRILPRSLDKTEAAAGGITAAIERLLMLDALAKPIERDMKKLIDRVKDHMAQTREKRIVVRRATPNPNPRLPDFKTSYFLERDISPLPFLSALHPPTHSHI